jgi:hypothetical protein
MPTDPDGNTPGHLEVGKQKLPNNVDALFNFLQNLNENLSQQQLQAIADIVLPAEESTNLPNQIQNLPLEKLTQLRNLLNNIDLTTKTNKIYIFEVKIQQAILLMDKLITHKRIDDIAHKIIDEIKTTYEASFTDQATTRGALINLETKTAQIIQLLSEEEGYDELINQIATAYIDSGINTDGTRFGKSLINDFTRRLEGDFETADINKWLPYLEIGVRFEDIRQKIFSGRRTLIDRLARNWWPHRIKEDAKMAEYRGDSLVGGSGTFKNEAIIKNPGEIFNNKTYTAISDQLVRYANDSFINQRLCIIKYLLHTPEDQLKPKHKTSEIQKKSFAEKVEHFWKHKQELFTPEEFVNLVAATSQGKVLDVVLDENNQFQWRENWDFNDLFNIQILNEEDADLAENDTFNKTANANLVATVQLIKNKNGSGKIRIITPHLTSNYIHNAGIMEYIIKAFPDWEFLEPEDQTNVLIRETNTDDGSIEKLEIERAVVVPQKVVDAVLTARNKATTTTAPANAIRHPGLKTPCVKTSMCMDCKSPDRICNTWCLTEKCFPRGRIKIVLINQDLGL